ncbi:pyridoxamine 5'-phosphate oxidase [Microbacterium sp. CH12i]|uniref:pyridoxamine 5'-phosphate oxidase family protein n=1 Tax=Microbacterium sp. CH12i TaxID=1479651 RepID=UPI00046124C8|nr:pyridoxamine 5'-phosphate oxidase family protein [Microbacterium sp. CH12i]KDA06370.1 pyridoxamine 5'-phosphate oxidase [Microbacterium sp. CH12i]
MSETNESIKVLSEDETWALLSTASFGRVAVSIAGQPEIFPVNYVAHARSVTFRTAEGTKLFGLTANEKVAFEVDHYTATEGWSIVAKGTAHALETEAEIAEAEQLPLNSWIASVKRHYVRIDVHELSGRRFIFGDDPDPEIDAS